MENIISVLISEYKAGKKLAIPSYCTGNKRVIRGILEYYKDKNQYVLLEATANQVNQFGGYTGMQPVDYKNMVYQLAEEVGLDKSKILLAGDHLGPLVWHEENENKAMATAVDLVRMFVLAGYQKIHLDTSMKLGDDDTNSVLSKQKIAERGAILCKACEEAFAEYKNLNADAVHPVYIIGSEVPIPGGASGEENEALQVTKVEDLKETLEAYRQAFNDNGLADAFKYIIAVVVQPGVEFDNDGAVDFDPLKAKDISNEIKNYKNIVFEGHSSDFQTPECLKQMVSNGVVILKVGPALTFAYREAITAMEKILFEIQGYNKFSEVLRKVMKADNSNWKNHYKNNDVLNLYLEYSFSDRCRYYIGSEDVQFVIDEMKEIFNNSEIPLFLIHQYLPMQYCKVRSGELVANFDSIIDDYIANVLENYEYAAGRINNKKYFV